jgi:tRNA(His) 5'-end guanylyltransferase
MLPEIQGVQFAYTQSDEVSLLLTDFATPNTDAWFDGNIQKMVSVGASIITAEFNRLRYARHIWDANDKATTMVTKSEGNKWNFIKEYPNAYFDARVFTIPDRTEVMNYFIWRNQDAGRNSVSMVAQSLFSHKELHGKSTADMQEMMFQKHNVNWSQYDPAKKNGRLIVKEEYTDATADLLIKHKETAREVFGVSDVIVNKRTRWVVKPAWKFTEDASTLLNMIPKYE